MTVVHQVFNMEPVDKAREDVKVETEFTETDWKKRAVKSEEQLFLLRERVNSTTTKIREAVTKRVKFAEECSRKAEERAEALLKKMQEFEEHTLKAEKKVTRCYERNQQLEVVKEQKELIIKQLQMTVAEQHDKHDADVKMFEKKVAEVKEWVIQIVGQLQNKIEVLEKQIEEKDELIGSLKYGYPKNSTIHTSTSSLTNGLSNVNEDNCAVPRERSKSTGTISGGEIEIETLPAVPPRRTSLGILNRANNSSRVWAKVNLKTLQESLKEPRSQKPEFDQEKLDKSKNVQNFSCTKASLNEEKSCMSQHCEQEKSTVSNSKFYISSENGDPTKAVVQMSMRERLNQLTSLTKGGVSDDVKSSIKHDMKGNNDMDKLITSLAVSSQNSNGYTTESVDKSTVAMKLTTGSKQKPVTVNLTPDPEWKHTVAIESTTESQQEPSFTVKLTAESDQKHAVAIKSTTESQREPSLTVKLTPESERKRIVEVKPAQTDSTGCTTSWQSEDQKDSNETHGGKPTSKTPGNGSTFTSYLPPEFLSQSKAESDSSGCSSLEHTPPTSGSWAQDQKSVNSTANGLLTSEDWKRNSDVDTIHGTPGGFACNLMQVQSCPVYAQLEGRASEIQNRPCTGESTDSSDDEAELVNIGDSESPVAGRVKSVFVGERLLRRGSCRKKVLKTCAQYTTHNLKSETLQKTGYLSKLGGRIKNWKRRWFVLSENKLCYYKSENDVNKKPLGQIPLDGFCRITRTEGSVSFQIDTAKRRYYLTGVTVSDTDEWLQVLQNVLRKFMASPLLAQVNEKAVIKGWITKAKLGVSKRCYCILRGKYLCYYKGESDQAPFGILNMKEVHIEKISSVDSEDDLDTDEGDRRTGRFTLRLHNDKQPSTSSIYLLIDTKQDHNAWLYHLTMASGHVDQTGTEFERTIARLREEDGNPESVLWNSVVITHSKEPLENPLTTLPSEELESKALQLFKSIQLFCNAECVQGPAIDYHVVYAQNALQMCMGHPELREEIYCQLMKQTAKRVHVLSDSADPLERFLAPHSEWLTASRTYSMASDATIDLRPTKEYVYKQCWQLLVLCCSLFVPRGQVLWFLKAHLQRHSSKQTDIGKYAKYCQHCLDRTIQNGEREAGPARMEVIAILLDSPFKHSYPLKIPVHFVNRTTEKFGFDGATTVQELIDSINSEIGLRSIEQSGYALYTDNPVGPVQHCLQTSVKLCDVIAKWEKTMQSSQQGRFEPNRMIKLTYKSRLYFKSLSKSETARERYFLVYETFDSILHGRFPTTEDRNTEMAALMAQMEFGDRVSQDNQSSDKIVKILERFYPRKLMEPMTGEQRRHLKNKFLDYWLSLMGKSKQECITLYLRMAKSWAAFGAKLFKAKQRRIATRKRDSIIETLEDVWLAVEENCISILDVAKLNPVFKYKYRAVVTFGGWKEDFMLVVNKTTQTGSGQNELGTERLLFVMPRGKILEITLLIASYINAIVRQQGITFDVTSPTKKTTGASEKKIKVWDMESAEWPMVPGAGLI